jgi:hypothetical protein
MWPGGGGGSVGSNCGRRRDDSGGSPVAATEWGGNDDVKGATQSVIKRGGNAGREVTIQQIAGARDMVAQRERRQCNNQPAQERCSARRETVA